MMNKNIFLLLLLVLMVNSITGQTNISVQLPVPDSVFAAISNGDSVKFFVGKIIFITGTVVRVTKKNIESGSVYYLEFFKPWPNNPFSVTIFRDQIAFFEPVEQYENKSVRLTGKVRSFTDKRSGLERYSISLRKPNQIVIIK